MSDALTTPALGAGPGPETVSVIICMYTAQRWDSLIAGLTGVLAQTRIPDEVLVVVDHNAPLLHRARHELGRRFPTVRVIESAGSPGLAGARNTGAAAATGEICAFLDDDACPSTAWLEELVGPYRADSVVGTGGTCQPAWETGRPPWFPEEFDWVVGCSYRGLPDSTGEIRNPIGASMSMRRSAWLSVGGFREDMGRIGRVPLGCEETELAIRVTQAIAGARIIYVPAAVVSHAVPASRSRLRYYLSRCHAEGLSKATVVKSVGGQDGLGAERSYIARTLLSGILSRITRGMGGDSASLAQAVMIIVGLAATAVGFTRGSLASALPTRGALESPRAPRAAHA